MGSPYIGMFMGVYPQLPVFFLSLSLLLKEEGGIESADSEAEEAIEEDEDEDDEEVDKERVGNEQVEEPRLVICILGQWSVVKGEEKRK